MNVYCPLLPVVVNYDEVYHVWITCNFKNMCIFEKIALFTPHISPYFSILKHVGFYTCDYQEIMLVSLSKFQNSFHPRFSTCLPLYLKRLGCLPYLSRITLLKQSTNFSRYIVIDFLSLFVLHVCCAWLVYHIIHLNYWKAPRYICRHVESGWLVGRILLIHYIISVYSWLYFRRSVIITKEFVSPFLLNDFLL